MDEDKKANKEEGICQECSSSLCGNCGKCCNCGECECGKCHPMEEDNEPMTPKGVPSEFSEGNGVVNYS